MINIYNPDIGKAESENVLDAISSTWISSSGHYLNKFETDLSQYVGVKSAIAVSNGTVALHLALMACDIGKGDEVIVPSFSFVASASSILHAGATPVFADVDPDTWCISMKSIERLVSHKTRAIIIVPLYGNSPDMDRIIEYCEYKNIFIIEDAAEALGSTYKNKKIGSYGHISTFSFYANKIITCGEGGAVCTNNENLAHKIRMLKNHGMDPKRKYWHPIVGYNYRMTNLQAAIGCAQLEKIDKILERKILINSLYREILSELPIDFQYVYPEVKNNCWMNTFTIKTKSKNSINKIIKNFNENGIEYRPLFPLISHMPPYKKYKSDKLPYSNLISQYGINLPSSPNLEIKEINFICNQIFRAFEK